MNNNFKYLLLTLLIGFLVIGTYYLVNNPPINKTPITELGNYEKSITNQIDSIKNMSGYNAALYVSINNKIDADFQNGIITDVQSNNLIIHSNYEQFADLKAEVLSYLKNNNTGEGKALTSDLKAYNNYSNKRFIKELNELLYDVKWHDYYLSDFVSKFNNFISKSYSSNCFEMIEYTYFRNVDMRELSVYKNLNQFKSIINNNTQVLDKMSYDLSSCP